MYGGERGTSGKKEVRIIKKKGNGCVVESKDTKLHFQTEIIIFLLSQ